MTRAQMEQLARTNPDAAAMVRNRAIEAALTLGLLDASTSEFILTAPWARETENAVCDKCGTLSAEFLPAWACELLLLARIIDQTAQDKYRESLCCCVNG